MVLNWGKADFEGISQKFAEVNWETPFAGKVMAARLLRPGEGQGWLLQ